MIQPDFSLYVAWRTTINFLWGTGKADILRRQISFSAKDLFRTDQADEDAGKLDDVGVGDGVEAADPGVHDGDEGAQDDGRIDLHVDDHCQSGSWIGIEKLLSSY